MRGNLNIPEGITMSEINELGIKENLLIKCVSK